MSHIDNLKPVHPSFSVPSCQIFSYERATVIYQSSEKQELDVIVATPGVFFIKTRTFPRHISVQDIIPFSDIVSMIVYPTITSIISNSNHISFRNSSHIKIAARIASIRQQLFNPSYLHFTLTVDSTIQNTFDTYVFKYETPSLIGDRFLSLALKSTVPLVSSQLESVYYALLPTGTCFEINSKVLLLNYQVHMAAAISYDQNISEIRVSDVPFSQALPLLLSILKTNTNVKRLTLSGTVMNSNLKGFSEVIRSSDTFKITELVILNSNLSTPESKQFFDSFKKCQSSFSMLIIDGCIFSEETFDSFSQAIFFAQCFHSIGSLWIKDIGYPQLLHGFMLQLFVADWVLKHKRLKTLAVIDSGLELGDFLSQIPSFDLGLNTMDFSGSTFIKPPPKQLTQRFGPTINLVLSDCVFSTESFIDVFLRLSEHTGKNLRLDLRNAHLNSESWKLVEKELPEVSIKSLSHLIWDQNRLSMTNIGSFLSFLSHQPNLKGISISDCIYKDECGTLLGDISQYFEKINSIQFLSLSSTIPNSSLGCALAPVLLSAVTHCKLTYLDITGQRIGTKALSMIIKAIPKTMITFLFDKNVNGNGEEFLEIISQFLSSGIKKSVWPELDASESIKRTHPTMQNDVKMRIDVQKMVFFSEIKKVADEKHVSVSKIEHYNSIFTDKTITNSQTESTIRQSRSQSIPSNITFSFAFVHYDEKMQSLLNECQIDTSLDPVLDVFNEIYSSL